MESVRQNKIGRLLQKEISDMLNTYARTIPGTLISVTTVRVSSDLSVARAYLSIFPNDRKEEIFETIKQSAKSLRFELASRTKLQLRKTPELTFFLDDSLDYIENIDNLLQK
ncbi:MAG: 30S ribosome-binding factor RbfA [Paludibacteraceae bacterium]|jgi:ribosome-binding factor A|nr:30S ribosome-binding factor RbfA [Paludibacteraceae bacterium]